MAATIARRETGGTLKAALEAALWSHVSLGGRPRDWVSIALHRGWIASGKQAHRTLEKWVNKVVYDYGVALDLGWPLPGKAPPTRSGEKDDPLLFSSCLTTGAAL